MRFTRPRVYVFTNTLPNVELMSKDRWNVWEMDDEFELVKYEPVEINETGEDITITLK